MRYSWSSREKSEMRYYTRTPPSPLGDYVALIWVYFGHKPTHRFERILPSGTVELVVNLREGDSLRCYEPETFRLRQAIRGPLLSGARAEYSIIDTAQQLEIMGVNFHPGGAYGLLGLPVDEVHGQDVPLSAVWGKVSDELHERLLAAPSPQKKLEIMEEVLVRQMRPERRLHPVMRHALQELDCAERAVEIGKLAAKAGWSDRHFIRTFSAQVGMTPKAYGRVRRFQSALVRIQKGKALDWAALAVDCGYYDQAHFIRDFRAFSGITPSAYLRLQQGELRHVPVPEQVQICPVEETVADREAILVSA